MTSPTSKDPEKRSARRKARKRALDILFEADVRGTEPLATARDRLAQSDPPVPQYAVTLIEGVTQNRARLDELIATYAEGWTIDRMPAVDRNLLRLGIYELLFRDDIPDVVAIDEAVDLARELSTDESPRFVNGLLGRLQLVKAEL
ncbi:transcription antitermination factor NusB [Cryptosporangium japonicum]|uniref:Transcription antitermination protein NusB n=1 Tax=Cryptosporangium japonicum TaxID=80872 RepID=A0ABN0V3Q8_9ACTN